MHRFVRVKFYNSSKLYDYLCDSEDVKKGDKVYVATRDGRKIVTVCGIFYSRLDDMPLPAYRYKKIEEKYVPPAAPKPTTIDIEKAFPKVLDDDARLGFEVIDSARGIKRSKLNRNLLMYTNHVDEKKHKFLLLRWRRGMVIAYDWFITDMRCVKKGDFVYINEHLRNSYPTYGRVEKIFEGTYADLHSLRAWFVYVDKVISSSEIPKAKEYLGIWVAKDYYAFAKECALILLLCLYVYYMLFTESGQELLQLSREFNRDFPRKP